MKQELQKLIDRAVGKGGNLSLPSWWMNKILNDLIKYCEEGDASSIKNYLNEYVKKEDIATINDKSIINGGNITIEDNESYDDTEIKQQLTELSTEIDTLQNEKLYAYPIEYYEGGTECESKVVELGGEKLYNYLGEISIQSVNEWVEGTLSGDIIPTDYLYQPVDEGVLQPYFDSEQPEPYFNLYIGNDKYGYTSLKVEPSEDPNNLKWFNVGLGMWQEGPGGIDFAWSNWTLYYRAKYVVPCNIKVYWLYRAKKLDVNLIPQEIARKEDIITEIANYDYPVVTVDADTLTYEGKLGSKKIRLNTNLSGSHFNADTEFSDNYILYLRYEDDRSFQYTNNYCIIVFRKNNNVFEIDVFDLLKPAFTASEYDIEQMDYKQCNIAGAYNVKVHLPRVDTYVDGVKDRDNNVTCFSNGFYYKFKLNTETHLLELQQEIDLSSIESRLSALESNVNIETTLTTEV